MMNRRAPYSGAFLMASDIVLHVPFPSFDTVTSACIAVTGICSNLLSFFPSHLGISSPPEFPINLLLLLFCMGTPSKSSPDVAENIARQLLTSSDRSLSLSAISSFTPPDTSANPSVHVSWLVIAALSHVTTSYTRKRAVGF